MIHIIEEAFILFDLLAERRPQGEFLLLCHPAAAIPGGCQADGTIYPEYPEEAECDPAQAKSRLVRAPAHKAYRVTFPGRKRISA